MKKILALTLSLMMAVSMAACSSGAGSSSAPVSSDPVSSETVSSGTSSSEATAGGIQTAADLEGKKIGVQDGTTGQIYVEENVQGAQLSAFKSGMDAALDLKNGKIDAVVLDELPAKKIVEQNPDLFILDENLTTEEYAIAVKKGNTELLDSINATIKKAKEDGTYDSLFNAFMPADGNVVIPEKFEAGGDKVLKMGTNAAFFPFEYVEGNEVVGFDVSMSQLVAKEYGATLQVEDMAFDSLLSALQSGVIDFVAAGMTATDERRQNVDFSDAYYSSKQVIILKK